MELNKAERDGLINRCERHSVSEVGLNSERNEDQPGTNGHGPGARRIGPGSCMEPGPKGPDEPGPMAHVAALLRVFLVRT